MLLEEARINKVGSAATLRLIFLFEAREATLMCKSLVDSIEEALIHLQYALADYYSCSANDPRAFTTLGAPLGELHKIVTSTQLALTQARLADTFSSTGQTESQKNSLG